AICRRDRREHPSRQGHPGQPDRNAPNLGRGKISERYKTTDQVEKATIEERNYTFLYEDGDGYHFMNPETYDQVQVSKDVIGDAASYLQESMTVKLSLHGANPVSIALPQRVTLEVVETEPVTK